MKNVLISFLFLLPCFVSAQEEARLLRFPSVSGNTVVFSYAGDLYTVSLTGGIARKLTSDKGCETFTRFSPDGKTIAFTGQYDGNTEIYTIPSVGGEPKRLTYTATLDRDDLSDRMGPNNIVTSWSPDGKSIIYRSRKKSWNDFIGQLFKVSVTGGMSEQLPLPAGGFNSWSPDGKLMAYNRVMREFRTWKYYKGGMADDIWIYDPASQKTENITSNVAQDIFPMWIGDNVYFISDRDRIMNLFCYDTKTKTTKKITDFKEYDIKFPSHDSKGIIFENGGKLMYYNVQTSTVVPVPVQIANDLPVAKFEMKDASKNIQSGFLSAEGDKVALGARGDIFIVPAKEGRTVNLTQSSGAHDRNVIFSPDGKTVAFLSDMSGEYEIYTQKADGSEAAVAITSGSKNYIFGLEWSPDGKKIMFSNREMKLMYVDLATKKVTTAAQSKVWEINDYNWSPDSKWIVYTMQISNTVMSQVWLYNTETNKTTAVSSEWYSSGSGIFSDDGRFLVFTSERDFNPVYSQTEWNHAYQYMSRIYLIPLDETTPVPFGPRHQELFETKTTDKPLKIDLNNIQQRTIALPVAPGDYWNLRVVDNLVYYSSRTAKEPTPKVKVYDIKEKKETTLGEYGFQISANGKKMLLAKDGKYFVIDRPDKEIKAEKALVTDLKVKVNIQEEWKQIYNEAWRQMRDFFYDPGMHGVNWSAMKDKYSALLPWAKSRDDVNYLIGELIGELNVGHAYVGGGDKTELEKIYTGLLGAEISKHSSGSFRIDKILGGQPWDNKYRSPLADVGVNVKEGEFIIAVDKIKTKDYNDIYELLWNKTDKQVELTISADPSGTASRTVTVIPVKQENDLYYYNWVQNNIKYVSEKTGGKVGYIHIPDMGVEGLNEFVKHFYPQLGKEALIIDDRGNGGGNVSPMIIERLRREIAVMGMSRNSVEGSPSPEQVMPGPLVLLVNNYSASDGDLFPYQFRQFKLGTIIGVRTWGGVVGIRNSLPFIDGAYLNRPEFAHYAANGSDWIIEGHGVDPDIVIDNDPATEFKGIDQQLDKAIEVILDDLKKNPVKKAGIPAFPDKTK